MKRLTIRSRSLLLVAALAVVAALGTGSTAHAASPGGSPAGTSAAAAHVASPSGTPCTFVPSLTCQSTNPAVTLNIDYTGDTSTCTFVWTVDWGDGSSTTGLTITDPADGDVFLANHTYATTPERYTITVTGEVTSGTCTANDFNAQFTLLASPPPPGSSPNKCRIDVRATGFAFGHLSKLGNHLYVVYTDMTGAQYHYEAVPSDYPYLPIGYIKTLQGTGATSTVGAKKAGPITALSGAQACGKDSNGDPVPGFDPSVVTQGPHACFLNQMAQIDKAKITYFFLTTNSNAFVYTILKHCGINPVEPKVYTPGWGLLLKY